MIKTVALPFAKSSFAATLRGASELKVFVVELLR